MIPNVSIAFAPAQQTNAFASIAPERDGAEGRGMIFSNRQIGPETWNLPDR